MTSVKDSFVDLERHVQQLEANVKQLRSALEHWRKWDAEYEALKEEVTAASQDGSREAAGLERVRGGFKGDVVSEKEVAEIFGQGRARRSASQVLGILDRRLDYVGTNVRTLERKVEEAERKVDAARVVRDPGAMDESGLPITEIFERLDEEGNVLSHELWTPGSKVPQVQEILGKAGMMNGSAPQTDQGRIQPVSEDEGEGHTASSVRREKQPSPKDSQPSAKSPPASEARPKIPAQNGRATPKPEDDKKVIGQVEETPSEAPEEPEEQEVSRAAKRVQQIMDTAREQENLANEEPVIPLYESAEDAVLRQEMLNYGIVQPPSGMRDVVAVMDNLRFENSDDDEEFNSFSDDSDEDSDEEDEEDEDKWGRTTKRVVSDKYQDRMLELEQRLGVQSRFTRQLAEEAAAGDEDEDDMEEGIGKIVINSNADAAATASTEKKSSREAEPPANGVLKSDADATKPKKSVRFAGSLDIAPGEPAPKPAPEKPVPRRPATENPVADLIVEQTGPEKEPPAPAETKPRKASRFKKMKEAAPKPSAADEGAQQEAEENPNGIMQDLAWAETTPAESKPRKQSCFKKMKDTAPKPDTSKPETEKPENEDGGIMEDLAWTESTPAEDLTPADLEDDFDESAVADEYHRRRRRMIGKQGGFLEEDKSEVSAPDGGKFVSKFRAARLSRQ